MRARAPYSTQIICPTCRGGGRLQLSPGEGACCDECDGTGRIGEVIMCGPQRASAGDLKHLQQALLDLRRGDGT